MNRAAVQPRAYGSAMTRDERIRERGRALIELVAGHFPQEFDVTGDADAWPLVGAGLVSRMTTTLGSVLDLLPGGREIDAGILVRSLYEHAVHFAWLGVDPAATRLEEWRKHDLTWRLKADTDARQHGVQLFTDDARTELEAQIGGLRGGELVLTNLAVAADRHWTGLLPGFDDQEEVKSFRGLYAILYRNYSGVAHPTYRGLNHVVEDLGPTRRRVGLEGPYDSNGPYGIATVIFALGLYVAGNTLGWPQGPDVNAIFERYP
jgi:hypothetical protein